MSMSHSTQITLRIMPIACHIDWHWLILQRLKANKLKVLLRKNPSMQSHSLWKSEKCLLKQFQLNSSDSEAKSVKSTRYPPGQVKGKELR